MINSAGKLCAILRVLKIFAKPPRAVCSFAHARHSLSLAVEPPHFSLCMASVRCSDGSSIWHRRLIAVVLNENLQRAGFSMHRAAAIRESGKGALELAFVWCAPQQRVLKKAYVENWDFVQKILDDKRGVIFLTPHLGCFEITAQVIASHLPLTVLYRPPRKAALKPFDRGCPSASQPFTCSSQFDRGAASS